MRSRSRPGLARLGADTLGFTAHDGEYRRSLKDWQSFVDTMTEKIIEVDFTIPELPAKDVVFRIHRDIRFSNDPTPYKAGLNTLPVTCASCANKMIATLFSRMVS